MFRVLPILLLSGCCLLAVQGPGDWTPESRRAPICDADPRGPYVADVSLAVLGGIVSIAGFASAGCEEGNPSCSHDENGNIVGVAGLGVVALSAFSVIKGMQRTRACRAAQADWAVSVAR